MSRVPEYLLIAFLCYLTVSKAQSPCTNSTLPISLISPLLPDPPEGSSGSSNTIMSVFYNCRSHGVYPANISYVTVSVLYINSMSTSQFYIRLTFSCETQWVIERGLSQSSESRLGTAPDYLSHDFIREDCYSCNVLLPPNAYGCMECNETCPGVNTSLGYCFGSADTECCPYSYNNKCINTCQGLSQPDTNYICVCTATCLNNGVVNSSCDCECTADFYGTLCENQHLPCRDSNPCVNGNCIDGIGPNSLTCDCHSGFTGLNCETNIDNCPGNRCGPGVCVDGVNRYSCVCQFGFRVVDPLLSNPECAVDNCATNPCLNGGTCNNTVGGYQCNCMSLSTGVNCSECVNTDCGNGTLVDCGCVCYSGHTGTFCDTGIDDCNPNPCLNGGNCLDGNDTFTCDCANTGFEGVMCRVDIDECLRFPCQNNAACINTLGSYTCQCSSGFDGSICQFDIDECLEMKCHDRGECVNTVSGFRCDCYFGFDGSMCQNVTISCDEFSCQNGGTCNQTISNISCTCAGNYTGDHCESMICSDGYESNGSSCRNIDECSRYLGICGGFPSVCTDTDPLYACTCPTGFSTINPQVPTQISYCNNDICMAKSCVDINECEFGIHNCHSTQICDNTNGGYICRCGVDEFLNLGACVQPLSQPDCAEVVDANGHNWPGTFKNSLVSLRCENSEAVATRACYPPCGCSGGSSYWRTPQIQNCISAQLQLLREEFQDVISDTNLSAARFRAVIESIRIYTASIAIKGFDPQILTNLLEEIVRTFERLNSTDWKISLFIDVVNIANALLATDPGVWNEVGNVTENILCLHNSILKISELISEFIYSDNSMNELNFASSLIELNIVKWDHFSSNIDLFNLFTPSNNFSLQIQNINLEDLNLPPGETPLTCHVFVRRLFLPSFNSLLGIKETLDDTCVNKATQPLVYPVGLFSFGVHTSRCDTPMITLPYPTNFFRVKLSTLPFQLSEVSYELRSVTNYSQFIESGSFPQSNCIGPFEELGDLLYYCHTIEDFILTIITQPDTVPFYASPFGISYRIFMSLSSIPLIIALFVIARGFVVIIDGAVFVRINVILIILISQLILTIGIDRTENDTVCIVLRFLLHYLAVATCIWAFIDAINICLITFFSSYYLIFNIVYVILGYLLPLIPVGIALSISPCPYFRTSPFCWPSNKSSLNAVWHIITPFYFMILGFTILMIVEIVIIVLKRARIVVDIANELNLLLRMLISSFILPFLLISWWIITLYAFGEDNPSTALEVLSLVMSCIVGMYVLTVFTILVHTTSVRKEERPTQITHFGDDGFQSNPIFRNNEIEMNSNLHTGVTFLSDLDTFF